MSEGQLQEENNFLQTLFQTLDVGTLRNFNAAESNVIPLILQRSPSQYLHSCSIMTVPKDYQHYNDLIDLLNNWYIDLPKGSCIDVDLTNTFDVKEFSSKRWYILDLRKQADTSFENCIRFKNVDKVSKHLINRISFMIYEQVKSLVVFADRIDDIPVVLSTLSILVLSSPSSYELTTSLINVSNETPKNVAAKVSSITSTTQLFGCHKFEPMVTFVCWPPTNK